MLASIRRERRALWTAAAVALLLLVSLIGALFIGLRSQAEDAARREFANLARVFEEHVVRVIRAGDDTILGLRTALEGDPAAFQLDAWMAANPQPPDLVPQIALIGADGFLTATSVGPVRGRIDLNDREHFQVHVGAAGDQLFISKPVLGRATGRWTIQLTRPYRRDGAFGGVIVLSLDIEYLNRFYNSVDIGASGRILLIGSADQVVRAGARSAGSNRVGEDLRTWGLAERARGASAGIVVARESGERAPILYAYRQLTAYPLLVAIGASEDDYLSPYTEKRPMLLAIALVAALTLLGAFLWLDSQVRRRGLAAAELVSHRLAAADAQAAMRVRAEQERRYRAATSAASDAILSWDENGWIVFANPSAQRLFGLPSEAPGTPYLDLFAPADAAAVTEAVRRLRDGAGAQASTLEVHALRPGGAPFEVEVSVNAWQSPEGMAVTMVARDIGARRAAEAERQQLLTQALQAQKMEALGTLAGGIAHDFNNVLGAMQGFLWLAKHEAQKRPEAAIALIDKAIAAGGRAAKVVKQLLDYARAEAHAGEQAFDACKVLREVAELAPASIPTTIDRSFVFGDQALTVMGDATQFHQVMLNLLINASHAIGDGNVGRIEVLARRQQLGPADWPASAPGAAEGDLPIVAAHWDADGAGGRLRLGALEPGPYCAVEVSDTGQGMSAAVMRRIFEPFFTTKPVGGGTGLGLSVLHGLVKAMKGGIEVRSRVGQGAVFTILLPLARSEGAPAEEPAAAPAQGGGGRILVVDDEEALRTVVRATLEQGGYAVTEAVDGRAALAMAEQDPKAFDLVLTDLTMPQMTGDRLAAELHRLRADLPVVIVTGRTDRAEALRDLAVAGVVTKPVYGERLLQIVATALRRTA